MNNSVQQRTPTGVIIMIVLFVAIVLFLAWQSYSSPVRTFMNLSVSIILLTTLWIMNFEWNPLHINPNFISADGTTGVVIEKPRYVGAKQYSMKVAVKKRYVKKPKYFIGWQGFVTMLSGNVALEVQGYESDFFEVPAKDSCPEGAIFYGRTVDGVYPTYKDFGEALHVKELNTNLVKLATAVEKAKSTMVAEAGEGNSALMEVAQNVTTLMNELKSKDIIFTPGFQPGGGR